MAKRRNKNKAKRNFAGLDRKVRINGEIVEKMLKMEAKTKLDSEINIDSVEDMCDEVQVTENCVLTDGDTENEIDCKENSENILKSVNKPRGRKPNKNKQKRQSPKPVADGNTTDEVIIYPTEVDGETCIDIKCGNNEAMLYLSKLCLGSKGACINFSDSWLTPNEFQSVSGRETAKDWKRSIRHKGRSLKLLISKGLINVQSVSPKKSTEKAVTVVEKVDNNDVNVLPISPEIIEPVKNEADNTVGNPVGNDTTIEQKAEPDTTAPIIPKKRGRKPKKARHWKKGMKFKPAAIERPLVNSVSISDPVSALVLQTDDSKLTSLVAKNRSGNEQIADEPSVDTRTDEERRLDEFVKTLKLTKACAPKVAPELSTLEKVNEVPETPEEEEPEMPVLQKEADISPAFQTAPTLQESQHADITVNVDHFHATVTPPPTPPSERTVIDRKTDDEKLIETFKSRLASPSNGLKLTINREKVKTEEAAALNSLCKTLPQEAIPAEKMTPKSNIQSLLLQDALQSAKRYKEQLKQNSLTPTTNKPIIHIPEVVPKVLDHKKSTNTIQHMTSSPYITSGHHFMSLPSSMPLSSTSSPSSSSHIPLPSVSRRIEKDRQNPFMQSGSDKILSNKHEVFNRRQPAQLPKVQTTPNGLPSMDIMQNLSGMSFQDFLTVVSSIYGPLPFPVDTKDAAFAALQELHRRHDMSMLRLVTQGQLNGSASSLLYPMMTQQILIAMTQQFYSLYNAPDWSPTTKCAIPKQIPKQIPKLEPSETQTRRPKQPSPDHSAKKRKYSDISDCALDLSVKRPKTEINRNYKTSSYTEVTHCDAPLDFSMKKTQYPYQYNNRGTNSTINSMNVSALDAEQLRRWSSQHGVATKAVSAVCSCGGAAEDDVTAWSVEQVCYFLQNLEGCGGYAKTFHDQGISGKLLPYLTTQHLTRTLGMKVGPALTLIQAVQDRREKSFTSLSRRQECRIHSQLATSIRTHI